jgi:hypothetical protein
MRNSYGTSRKKVKEERRPVCRFSGRLRHSNGKQAGGYDG